MRVALGFLADEANVSQDGKLNVLGMFDRIAAATFPVVHPKMVFVFRVVFDFADGGRALPVQVRMVDEDGQTMFEANGEITAPPVAPGDFFTANQLFALVGVQFPRPGTYSFLVTVDDQEPHETPLIVSHPPVPEQLN